MKDNHLIENRTSGVQGQKGKGQKRENETILQQKPVSGHWL